MPDKLRKIVSGSGQRRRLGGDLPLRNDMLSNRQQEYITEMITRVNPASPFLIFTGLLGDSFDPIREREIDRLFDFTTSSIGSEFIRIQEEVEDHKVMTVLDSSRVPTTLVAGQPFEAGVELGVLDEGEYVQLHDEETMLRVVSRRNTGGKVLDVTFELVGQVGVTAPGYLVAAGMPINVGYGNSKGEGSENGNTLELPGQKKNLFSNPMQITRYMWKETGSWMSDEVFKFSVQQAMDGSKPYNFYVDISVRFFREALRRLEGQIMNSRANFDPDTLAINSTSGADNTSYPDRPSYAGIWEQLDQTPVKIPWPIKSKYLATFNKMESMQNQMQAIWPGCDVMIVCQGPGKKFILDAWREGGQAKYPTKLNREIPASGKIPVGYGISEVVNDYGKFFIYDIGQGYQTKGEFANWTYNGVTGSRRTRDIFFIPLRKGDNGSTKKIVKYYTKSGKKDSHQQVDRGMVFGRVKGITGEGNGRTGAELMGMQESAFQDMVNNSSGYEMNSRVDGSEYHILFEGVPYIDIMGIMKWTIVD